MESLMGFARELLITVLDKDCRRLVAGQIVRARTESSVSTAELDQAIRRGVRIKGFQNPTRAPSPMLERQIADTMPKSSILTIGVVRFWVRLNGDLAERARAVIPERIPDYIETARRAADRGNVSSLMTLLQADADNLRKDTAYSRCEALLMLIYIMCENDVGEENADELDNDIAATVIEKEPAAPDRVCWGKFLANIRALPV